MHSYLTTPPEVSQEMALVRDWNNDRINYECDDERHLTPQLKPGMVIGTYLAIPYIHLQLESRRRNYPNVPCLVHNDGTEGSDRLRELCRDYKCDFEYNVARKDHTVGDLTAFVGGLLWAKACRVDLLLKVSRRWIFLTDWTRSLVDLAIASQYSTYSSYCTTYNFGFRTECMAMDVINWTSRQFIVPALSAIRKGDAIFMESYIHQYAIKCEDQNSVFSERWRINNPSPDERRGYAQWNMLGTSRHAHSEHYLWHNFSIPRHYFEQGEKWGLPYTEDEYCNPNA